VEEESKLTKYILSPLLSGVYVSKSDMVAIASSCGYALQIEERKRMLKEIFAVVREPADYIRIVDAFLSFYGYKEELYRSISREYPSSEPVTEALLKKIETAKTELERAKEEAKLLL